jgi:hypothetical protein
MPRVTEILNPNKAPKVKDLNRIVNHIALVIDKSGSMQSFNSSGWRPSKLVEQLNKQVDAIKLAAREQDQETTVSMISFGERVTDVFHFQHPEAVQRFVNFGTNEGSTRLYDGVLHAIRTLEKRANDSKNTSMLVIVLTDGIENASTSSSYGFREAIANAQKTDRWSFAFMVPPGMTRSITTAGVPAGNVTEWEQTERGLEEVSEKTVVATRSYYQSRAAGSTSSASLYTNPGDIKPATLKRALDDVSADFRRFKVTKEEAISDFVSAHLGHYPIGNAYYELTKPEKIQNHKKILIEDKVAKKIYGGDEARELLGIASGTGVEVRVKPGNHGNYRIYVNSTSTNRKLVRGTDVLVQK